MMSSHHDSVYDSPTAVVDMRLLTVNEDKLLQNLQSLRTPLSPLPILSKDSSDTDSSLPPPLNTLSVCSSSANDENDDSSSVSSVSLDDEDTWETIPSTPTTTEARRCIFDSYWKKKGGRPKQSLLMSASPIQEDSQQDLQDVPKMNADLSSLSSGSYEHLLEKNETTNARRESNASSSSSSSTSSSSSRRRLWGDNHYVAHRQSEPLLTKCAELSPLRKTRSASLVTTPPRSCLRTPRYSGKGSSSPRRSSESSVSFSEELVQVQYLMPVTENWAPKGWSKLFV